MLTIDEEKRLDLIERQLINQSIRLDNLTKKTETWIHTIDILSSQFNNLQFGNGVSINTILKNSKIILDGYDILKKSMNETLDNHHDRIHNLEIKDNLKIL